MRCGGRPEYSLLELVTSCVSHLMCYGVLGLHPAPAPVPDSDQVERAPEYQVGGGDDGQHLHLGYPLLLHTGYVVLHLAWGHSLL